jgi:hypothetical protein
MKSGSPKEIRLKPALKSARSGDTTRIVLKSTLFVARTDKIRLAKGNKVETGAKVGPKWGYDADSAETNLICRTDG